MFNFSRLQIIILLIVIIISVIVGYLIGNLKQQPSVNKALEADMVKVSPLFQFQTAIIPDGKITAINDNIITVTNDKNQKGEFRLAKRLAIYKPIKPNSSEGTSSSDIKSIELNQKATIVLKFSNGQFEVTEISYIPQSGQ